MFAVAYVRDDDYYDPPKLVKIGLDFQLLIYEPATVVVRLCRSDEEFAQWERELDEAIALGKAP